MWWNFFRCGVVVENIYLVCKVVDLWDGCDLDVVEKFIGVIVEVYGVVVFVFICVGFWLIKMILNIEIVFEINVSKV